MLTLLSSAPIASAWSACIRVRRPLFGALVAFLLNSRMVQAEPASSLVIEYEAPEGCSSEAEFRERVHAKLRKQLPSDASVSFGVSIDARGQGKLSFVNADGETVVRSLHGHSCEETSTAMELIVALAVDAWVENRETAEATSAAEGTVVPTADGVAEEPSGTTRTTVDESAAPTVTPSTPTALPAVVLLTPEPAPLAPTSERRGFGAFSFSRGRGLDLGVAAAATTASAPGLVWGPAAFVGVHDNLQLWALRFSASFFRSSNVRALSFPGVPDPLRVRTGFRRIAFQADACPHLIDTKWVQFFPCAFFELGQLQVSPDNVQVAGGGRIDGKSAVAPWIAAGALLRADVRLLKQWYFEVQGGLEVPLLRSRFAVSQTTGSPTGNGSDDPSDFVYTVRSVGFEMGIGIGVFVQ